MNGQLDAVVSGYVSMDRIVKIDRAAQLGQTSLILNGDHAAIRYGGCSINIAAALGRLGKNALPLIRVGGDYEEIGFKRFLEESGVDRRGLEIVNEETTSGCYLIQDGAGQHITLFYPGAMDGKYFRPYDEKYFKEARIGILTVAPYNENELFFENCRKYGLPIFFGMKADFNAFPENFLQRILNESRFIFMNESEQRTIESIFSLRHIADLFNTGGAEAIVSTRGEAGSVCFRKEGEAFRTDKIPACKPKAVLDTTGVGDAYIAGFVQGYLEGSDLRKCCMMGSVLSSFVIEAEGCCTNLPDQRRFSDRFNRFEKEINQGENSE